MIKIFKKSISSPSIMTWTSYSLQFGIAIFLLPLILINFTASEVSVWLLFQTIISFALLADTGFGSSIVRSASYFYSGAQQLPKNIKEFKQQEHSKHKKINFSMLKTLLDTTAMLYWFLAVVAVVLLFFVGGLILENSIQLAGNSKELQLAFYLLVLKGAITLLITRWISFIQGVDKVASIRRIETVLGLIKLLAMILVVLQGYKIFALMAVDVFYSLILLVLAKRYVKNWFSHYNVYYRQKLYFDKKLFFSIWPSTWRWGVMMYGGYFVVYGNSIIVAQIDNPKLIASFLLTQRLIFFIRQIAQVPLYANLPRIFQMLAKKEFYRLKSYCARAIAMGLLFQLISLVIIALLGNVILAFFDLKIQLVSTIVFLVMAMSIMLELHHAYHAQIYMGSNHIPFVFPALVSGVAILLIGFSVVDRYGLLGVVLTQFFVQLSINNWYPVYKTFNLLNWNVKDYLKSIFDSIFIYKLRLPSN